ncbi:helix-turn-helix domain-containing protein [Bradyrhizobium sp. USDA 4474]
MPRQKSPSPEEIRNRRRALSERARQARLALPHAIREMRESLGLSRDDFADLIVLLLTSRQIADIETGRSNPTARTLETVGRIFGFRLGFIPVAGVRDRPDIPSTWLPPRPTAKQAARRNSRHRAAMKRRTDRMLRKRRSGLG